ncbi:hypothetical protein MUB24_12955 [Lederbergia sp. NSJ-179]|uniref:hypothetical protein n=1 Tax=Lederbergia sp. NSJ-179 TaxID=2931402 RepID=UPI001FD06521|nr:hypothetical protein [Lederbergia sp. NSJ-179]MCJ7841789.1 hypothetical protein [Lederbergia sp. NSJ-179]
MTTLLYGGLLIFSFIISILVSVSLLKKKKSLARIGAFIVNTAILISATWILYHFDAQAKVFGIGDYYILVLMIPVLTWINFLILEISGENFLKRT